MSDTISKEQRHNVMAAIHSTSTKPELKLRHALWRQGFRYRTNDKKLPGKPDIVLPKYRTVIFIHGCFWHGHKGCRFYTIPKTNTDFWTSKVARNQERDQEVWRHLEAKGWSVIIVWECQLKRTRMEETISLVESKIYHYGDIYQKAKDDRKALRLAYREERNALKEKENILREELQEVFQK